MCAPGGTSLVAHSLGADTSDVRDRPAYGRRLLLDHGNHRQRLGRVLDYDDTPTGLRRAEHHDGARSGHPPAGVALPRRPASSYRRERSRHRVEEPPPWSRAGTDDDRGWT